MTPRARRLSIVFQEIRIRGVGVIDDAVLELSPGLNVVTGETGAGKTMVVSGLGLLLGARGDSGLVRDGAVAAVVEGLVSLPADHPALVRAAEAGADVEDDLVLARTVTREGRSRAHVGGRSSPVGLLAELGEHLVAVHGQADQWRLRQGDQHREVLDDFGGATVRGARAAYELTFDALTEAVTERDRLRRVSRERAREVDVLRAGLDRIAALDPEPGEDLSLRAEDERLAHADGLRLAAEQAHTLLAGGDPYAGEDVASVTRLVGNIRAALAPMVGHDETLRGLDERVGELGYLAGDLSAEIASYLSGVEVDPARLGVVQQRRADLSTLTRAYGDTIDEVLAWTREAAVSLTEILGADDRVEQLERETDRLRSQLGVDASALSGVRRHAADELGVRVSEELGHLSMGKAQVRVQVAPRADPDGLPVDGLTVRYARHGADDVEILLAANAGSPARSVVRAASGGELSRVMLALEVVTGGSGRAAVPTFVFDEVDAGVGGKAAIDVGARLAVLARTSQVIVVTHLAQVAAFADRHLVVVKDDDGRITSSSVTEVVDEARLRELSRMMGGDPDSAAGLEHARELVEQAGRVNSASRVGRARHPARAARPRPGATPA